MTTYQQQYNDLNEMRFRLRVPHAPKGGPAADPVKWDRYLQRYERWRAKFDAISAQMAEVRRRASEVPPPAGASEILHRYIAGDSVSYLAATLEVVEETGRVWASDYDPALHGDLFTVLFTSVSTVFLYRRTGEHLSTVRAERRARYEAWLAERRDCQPSAEALAARPSGRIMNRRFNPAGVRNR